MSDAQRFDKPGALLSPAQVATELSISRSRVYQWVRRGQLPAVKVGASVRVDPADLADLLVSMHERRS